MSARLMSRVRSVFTPVSALRECQPNCQYETTCSGGVLLRRQCCYRPDCSYYCSAWQQIGAC